LYLADTPERCCALPEALPPSTRFPGRRKPLSPQTARAVSRATRHTSACHQCYALCPHLARSLLRLAHRLIDCHTTDLYPLASPGVPAVLALEIASWTTTHSGGAASAYPPDGP